MNITGKIKGIKYKILLANELVKVDINSFDVNLIKTACIVQDNEHFFAVSKWVSPKRTRSYPYERVYNTLNTSKKITIIPIIKDEGSAGDRDFLQWDTISLMSLLDVFVIFAYYNNALKSKKKNKITSQKFDNNYIINKVKEIEQYHSSALHWNLNELKTNLHTILERVKVNYIKISKKTRVTLHNSKGIDSFKKEIGEDVSMFMQFSRGKAAKAQTREFQTIQPKENLSTATKAKITIINYLGGQYFFTVDEMKLVNNMLCLIEGKHSESAILPARSDIKDGLLKMILYCNLTDVKVDNEKVKCTPILELTSKKLKGSIGSDSEKREIDLFFKKNNFSGAQKKLINMMFEESRANNFKVNIKKVK